MSLSSNLIEFIRAKPVDDHDLAAAAMSTLDALATAYAGSATPTGQKLIAWAKSGNLDDKNRTLLMAALTHITETDDLHRVSVTHPGCVVIPPALSLGEKTGAAPDKILRAILHGFEAMCRIGAAVGPTHYKIWHNTATCGRHPARPRPRTNCRRARQCRHPVVGILAIHGNRRDEQTPARRSRG